MIETTVLIVLVATLYSLYRWPYLRACWMSPYLRACWQVFKWRLGFAMLCVGLKFALGKVLDNVESITAEGPLYRAGPGA